MVFENTFLLNKALCFLLFELIIYIYQKFQSLSYYYLEMATFSNNGESSNESLNKSCEISSLNSQEKNETAGILFESQLPSIE